MGENAVMTETFWSAATATEMPIYSDPETLVPAFAYDWIGCNGNPINFVDPDGRDAIFVHGTWSDPGTFTIKWKNVVLNTLNDVEYNPQNPFMWTGGNFRFDRQMAASDLFNQILKIHRAGRPINLVAHSHGGNTIFELTQIIRQWNLTQNDNIQIRNVILIGTPIRDDHLPVMDIIGSLNIISNEMDLVQLYGGYNGDADTLPYIIDYWVGGGGGEIGTAGRFLFHPSENRIFLKKGFMRKFGANMRNAHGLPKENVQMWHEIAPSLNIIR